MLCLYLQDTVTSFTALRNEKKKKFLMAKLVVFIHFTGKLPEKEIEDKKEEKEASYWQGRAKEWTTG